MMPATVNPRPTQTSGAFRSYKTAHTLLSIIEILGWILVGIGVLIALVSLSAVSDAGRSNPFAALAFPAIATGVVFAVLGLLFVMSVQIGRATVHTAEMTGEMLRISREQLEFTKQQSGTVNMFKPGQAPAAGGTAASLDGPALSSASSHAAPAVGGEVEQNPSPALEHRGVPITREGSSFRVGARTFETEGVARTYIDRLPRGERDMILLSADE